MGPSIEDVAGELDRRSAEYFAQVERVGRAALTVAHYQGKAEGYQESARLVRQVHRVPAGLDQVVLRLGWRMNGATLWELWAGPVPVGWARPGREGKIEWWVVSGVIQIAGSLDEARKQTELAFRRLVSG